MTEAPTPPASPTATQFEAALLDARLTLGDLLGRGAMADVYRAHDHLLDRAVAVKLFRQLEDPVEPARHDVEAHALAKLSHPGLVALFDIGTLLDRPCLVMQFVDGPSLANRLTAGPLPLDTTIGIGTLLADALAHTHSLGVIHRDVKPSNILLDAEDHPHLTDFGIALFADAEHPTSTADLIGSPAYVAPEPLAGEPIGPAVDIYGLGLVLLECLTGQREYDGESRPVVALERLHRPPHIPVDLPPKLATLLTLMTARDPHARPTADECHAALAELATSRVDYAVVTAAPAPDLATPTAGLAALGLAEPALAAAPEAESPVGTVPVGEATTQVVEAPSVRPGGPRTRRPLAAAAIGVAAVAVMVMFLLNLPHQSGVTTPPTNHPAAPNAAATAPGNAATGNYQPVDAHRHESGSSAPAAPPPSASSSSAPAATAPSTTTAPARTSTTQPTTTTQAPTTTSDSPTTTPPPTTTPSANAPNQNI